MKDSFVYIDVIGEPRIGHWEINFVEDKYIVFTGTNYECHAYVSGFYAGKEHGEMNAR